MKEQIKRELDIEIMILWRLWSSNLFLTFPFTKMQKLEQSGDWKLLDFCQLLTNFRLCDFKKSANIRRLETRKRPESNKCHQSAWASALLCEERVRRVGQASAVIEWHRLSSPYFSIKLASFRCNFSLIPPRLNPDGLHDSYSRWRRQQQQQQTPPPQRCW